MAMDWGKDLHLGWGKRKRNDEGTSLGEDAIVDDGSCCPTLLPKHKIFLSHSGKQKWFVEKLCEDLEARHRFPFFDKRALSLPKGERFPKLILEAAERCEMAVVVLSEDFLTSKWPMIELSTFVRALSGSNPRLKILPLFFELTVGDLGNPSKRGAWSEVWDKWARDDPRMRLVDLEEAMSVIGSFNGIVFNGDMNNVWRYERDVVENICSVVRADVNWDDSHVQGRSSICEATREKMKVIEVDRNGIYVFGYYGIGGIGKTTMCKTLCNGLSEFSGKVCHVELGGIQSVEQMLKKVLKKLTNTSEVLLQTLGEGECRNILKNRSSWRERTFLAIDNVWNDLKSMEQAEMFLKDPPFHEGSVVMVMSRCRSTLTRVGIEESHCFEVPELGEVGARKLFLHHVAGGKEYGNEGDNVVIDECIARCRFRKSETQGFHYLPLALKALGVHLRRWGPSPTKWLEGLPKVRDFNGSMEEENPVFSIIRLNFDRLSVQLQALFMDIAVFHARWTLNMTNFTGLSLGHGQKLQDTKSQLQLLKDRGLLEDVDMESERVSMHDLYKEFAEMEAKGKLNSSAGMNNRKWVYSMGWYLSGLDRTPSRGCWENLIRVCVVMDDEDCEPVFNLRGIQWRYFSNLVLLSLRVSVKVTGVLNLEGLRCLRSLELKGFNGSDGVDGLKDLNNLVFFSWDYTWNCILTRSSDRSESDLLGQLSASLKVLHLWRVDVCLRSDMFDCCTNLLELTLHGLRASDRIEMRQCRSLRTVALYRIGGLETLLITSTGLQSCLYSLRIECCEDLSCVLGLGDLVRLEHLYLCGNPLLEEVPNLQKLTSLQTLYIFNYAGLTLGEVSGEGPYAEIRGLGNLGQLRVIRFGHLFARELPNLNTLKHLHELSLQGCEKLTLLEGVEGLTALRCLALYDCLSLSRLPDLSKSTKLESLDLRRSGIELHEEDIDMLAALPGLRSVIIGVDVAWSSTIDQLDPVRRKVVISEKYGGKRMVEERDLDPLPIKVRDITANH